MSNTNTGGPAFPVTRYVNADGETFDSSIQGMSLRDYFAAKALQGLMAGTLETTNPLLISKDCYVLADAMLKERK